MSINIVKFLKGGVGEEIERSRAECQQIGRFGSADNQEPCKVAASQGFVFREQDASSATNKASIKLAQ